MEKIIKLLPIFIILYVFICDAKINSKVKADSQVICADETGPLIEFKMPGFKESSTQEKFSTKYFYKQDRTKFVLGEGIMKKKNSPIDYSYFFYNANIKFKIPESQSIQFDFFPPTHMMIKTENSTFISLVCWKNE